MTERISYQEVSKGLVDGLTKTEVYLKKSGMDLKLLELIKFRISQINGCAFCLDMHHKEALALGETELRLHSVVAWRECPFYTEKEKAVFEFAEVLTLAHQHEIEEELFQKLENCFTKSEIADLTLAITQINSWNRINKVFRPVPGNYQVGQYGI